MSRDSILRKIQACALGAMIGIALSQCSNDDDKDKKYDVSSENTGVAIIMDGNVYVNPTPDKLSFVSNNIYDKANKYLEDTTGLDTGSYPIVEYNINQVDDKTLIIYTYNEDENKRNSVMNYIISNVSMDENNNVYLDEASINQQSYTEYVSNALGSQTADVQRTRGGN